jgi:DNA-binding transcriptional regulator YiaG
MNDHAINLLAARAAVRQLPPPAERRAIRRAARVSVVEIADVLGVSELSVRHWEAGTATPNPRNAEAYGRLLEALRRVAVAS